MLPIDELFASNLTAMGSGSIPNFRLKACASRQFKHQSKQPQWRPAGAEKSL
jgi:hypothetical protein